MNSGNRPIPSLEYPSLGAVVTKELEAPRDLPPFVAIRNSPQRAGFLGVQYAPLNTNATPQPGRPFSVRGITLSNGVTIEEIERRQNLLQDLDKTFAAAEKINQLLGSDSFSVQRSVGSSNPFPNNILIWSMRLYFGPSNSSNLRPHF